MLFVGWLVGCWLLVGNCLLFVVRGFVCRCLLCVVCYLCCVVCCLFVVCLRAVCCLMFVVCGVVLVVDGGCSLCCGLCVVL